MPCFAPADLDSLWFDIPADAPLTIAFPPRASGGMWFGPQIRLAVPVDAADVLLRVGGAGVGVTADNGILFPAGNIETWSMGEATFMSAVSPAGPSRLCITIGHGE